MLTALGEKYFLFFLSPRAVLFLIEKLTFFRNYGNGLAHFSIFGTT